jgi:hypothetical protein
MMLDQGGTAPYTAGPAASSERNRRVSDMPRPLLAQLATWLRLV